MVVSPPGENSVEPQVALNQRGDAVVVWRHWIDDHRTAVEFVSRSAGGQFSAPALVDTGDGNFEPRVALDEAGNAVLTWVESTSTGELIRARAGRAGGAFGVPSTLGHDPGYAGSHDSCIGVDASGKTSVFWTEAYDQNRANDVHFAVRPAGGSFGPAMEIPNPGDDAEWPRCAVSANGDTFVSWTDRRAVFVATRRAGQASFSTQVVKPADSNKPLASIARLASNAKGEAIVTWSEATDDSSTQFLNKAAWRPSGGTFGSPETVGPTHGGGTGPIVAADGTATLIGINGDLMQPPREGSGVVERRPAGGYGPYQPVTSLGWDQEPEMAFDSAGNLFAAWRRYYDRSAPYGVAYGMLRPAGGTFPVPETPLSYSGRNVWDMVLDAGAGGHALAAWPRGTFPYDFHIELSEFGAAPAVDESSGGTSGPTGGDAGAGEAPPTSANSGASGDPSGASGDPSGTSGGSSGTAPAPPGTAAGSQPPPAMHAAATPPMTPTGSPHHRTRCRRSKHRSAHHHSRRACRRHRHR